MSLLNYHHPLPTSLWANLCAPEAAQKGLLHEQVLGIMWPPTLTCLHLATQQDPRIEFKSQKWERQHYKVAKPLLSFK